MHIFGEIGQYFKKKIGLCWKWKEKALQMTSETTYEAARELLIEFQRLSFTLGSFISLPNCKRNYFKKPHLHLLWSFKEKKTKHPTI